MKKPRRLTIMSNIRQYSRTERFRKKIRMSKTIDKDICSNQVTNANKEAKNYNETYKSY